MYNRNTDIEKIFTQLHSHIFDFNGLYEMMSQLEVPITFSELKIHVLGLATFTGIYQ